MDLNSYHQLDQGQTLYGYTPDKTSQITQDAINLESQAVSMHSSSAFDPRNSPIGMFQCGFCKKSYNRADHLQRHVRSHNGEKPYACDVCTKSFGRPDLLKRHIEGHASDRPDGAKRRKTAQNQAARVTQACRACSSSKIKCDDSKPCTRCRSKGLACEPLPIAYPPQDIAEPASIQRTSSSSVMTSPLVLMKPEDQLLTPGSLSHGENIIESEHGGFFPDIFGTDLSVGRGARVAADYIDQGTAAEAGPLSAGYVTQEIYDWNNPSFSDQSLQASLQSAFTTGEEEPISLGQEVLKQTSEWTPTPEDNGYREQVNVALPPGIPSKARRRPRERYSQESLSHTTRDRILNLVIQNSRPENVEKIVGSFPSTELFDDFIHHFFSQFTLRIDDWIHLGTFRSNEAPTLLIAAVIGTGLVYDEQHVLRTIGYALVESTRYAFFKAIEAQNSLVRDPQIHEAYMLQIETTLYSCNKRKLEISESLFQPGLTMLRRSRQFRRSEYANIVPDPQDNGQILDQKWKSWAKQEERKRTVFHTVIHDVRHAVLVNTTPLISSSELVLPLPETEALWRARTALDWKAVYQQRNLPTPARLPSLLDALQDTTHLVAFEAYLDMNLSLLVIVHSLWTLTSQHRQIVKLSQQTDWNDSGADSTAYTKCQALLQQILKIMNRYPNTRPEVSLMHAFVTMHSHISFEELHLFAGKEDKAEAKRVYLSARRWIDSSASRQAIWNAGQVLRHARTFPQCTFRDAFINIMFHVSMVFWSYGVLVRAHSSTPVVGAQVLCLDEVEPQDPNLLQAFFEDRMAAIPMIRFHKSPGMIGVTDPTMVLDELQNFLKDNWPSGAPEFIKAMRRLISDLGGAARVGKNGRGIRHSSHV